MNMRDGLGQYVLRDNVKLPRDALTLHDLGELIRRAGRQAKFIVESEYPVETHEGGTIHHRNIDWVWLLDRKGSDRVVVAFELEGVGVPKMSLDYDKIKFVALGAELNVIGLFRVNHTRKLFNCPTTGPTSVQKVSGYIKWPGVRVCGDDQLMAPRGIECLMKDARKAATGGRLDSLSR